MAGRDILINLIGRETVSPAARKAADGVDKLGDRMEATADDAQRLDREIEQAERGLRDLAVQYARTQDAADRLDLAKAMRRQQAELRKSTRARDLLPDFAVAGEEAASGFGVAFVGRVGPLLAKAPVGPAGAAIGAALAVGLVPTLSAAVGGAVLGGVGVGGVVGGIALAAKDSRVQAAAKQLGAAVMGDLEESAARFVGPTVHGIGIIRGAWADVADEVDDTFAATSRYVEPLARGVADAVREIAPGFREAAEAAGPIIREIREGLPRLGRALGDALEGFAEHADEGASALRWVFIVAETGIRVVASLITGFTILYRRLLDIGEVGGIIGDTLWGWIPGLGSLIDHNRERIAELKGALEEGGDAGSEAGAEILGGLLKIADGAGTATSGVKSFTQAIQELRDQNLSVIESEIQFERALDETAAAAKNAKGGLDKNTESGRQNWEILTRLVRDTKSYAGAVLERTGSEDEAAKVTEEGRKAFIRAARQMGESKEAAEDYANQLFGIPRDVDTNADFHPDNAAVKKWKQTLSGIPRHIFIKAEFDLINSPDVAMALRLGRLSKGGPVTGPGPKGVDSQPYLLAPGEHVLTADEVDAAGGHGNVEKLRAALRGEGGVAVPAKAGGARSASGGGGGGTQRIEVVLRLEGNDRGIIGALLKGIKDAGGNPAVLGVGGNW